VSDGDRSFAPVERPVALAEQVYHALRERLRSGAIGPGQPLQEVQLADALGVSRTPVREAMARLASEGLLASEGRSFTVPALSRQDVDDIYEVRYLVEPAALKRIAPLTVNARMRIGIDAALAAAVAAHRAGDADAFRQAHVDYRNAWLALVRNARLVRVVEQYADHMQHIRTLTLGDAAVRTIVLKGLKRVAAALAAGEGDGAAAAMLDHLRQAHRVFIEATGLGGEAPGGRNGQGRPHDDGSANVNDGRRRSNGSSGRRRNGKALATSTRSATQ
jgi:DNA-binding GntR family transcriptional regulator